MGKVQNIMIILETLPVRTEGRFSLREGGTASELLNGLCYFLLKPPYSSSQSQVVGIGGEHYDIVLQEFNELFKRGFYSAFSNTLFCL